MRTKDATTENAFLACAILCTTVKSNCAISVHHTCVLIAFSFSA